MYILYNKIYLSKSKFYFSCLKTSISTFRAPFLFLIRFIIFSFTFQFLAYTHLCGCVREKAYIEKRMVKNIQTCVTTVQNRNRKISGVSDFRLWSQVDPGLNPEFAVDQNPSGFWASDTLIYKNWVVGSVPSTVEEVGLLGRVRVGSLSRLAPPRQRFLLRSHWCQTHGCHTEYLVVLKAVLKFAAE